MTDWDAEEKRLRIYAIGRKIADVRAWELDGIAYVTLIVEDGGALTFANQPTGLKWYWKENA